MNGRTHIIVLLMSGFALAKGPWIHGEYRGVDLHDPERQFEVRFGMFNLPAGTTARITSCNFCYTDPNPDILSTLNIITHNMETYLRDVVYTRMEYAQPNSWNVDYAYVETNGRVVPMATITIPDEEPGSINVRLKSPSVEFVMHRVSE